MNLSFIADIIFPAHCVSCGDPVLSSDNGICRDCSSELRFIENGCPCCSGIMHEGGCTICSDREFYPERNIILFEYKGTVMNMIHALKFKRIRSVSRAIISFAADRLGEIADQVDFITPVPMVKKKERARGYNQSALIAEGIAKALGKPFKLLLREKENSMVQRDLNYTERFINVIDRYEIIENSRIIDKNILVVDDVFTTGATLNECSRSLITGGAEKVFTFALARSDLRRAENL